jgi:hypothetical protein
MLSCMRPRFYPQQRLLCEVDVHAVRKGLENDGVAWASVDANWRF